MKSQLGSPLLLRCGVSLENRLMKAPMTEGLADERNRATPALESLYARWADGGCRFMVTGNILVDRNHLERPGNVVADGAGQEELASFAKSVCSRGVQLWAQLNHPGRQSPRRINPAPVAPSAIPLNLPHKSFAPPRALSRAEIAQVIDKFVIAAVCVKKAGFTGLQIHAAHGYLLSQFLSPLANRRDDEWGGCLENRARLLLEIVGRVRVAVGARFPIAVKLNSSDFQRGGFDHDDSLRVVQWLDVAGVDLLEISGGNYEQPHMFKPRDNSCTAAPSTIAREAYFLSYAQSIRSVTGGMKLAVTGGFRTAEGMQAALDRGALDVIGIGRPLCVQTDAVNILLSSCDAGLSSFENEIEPANAQMAWFCTQLRRLGAGRPADRFLTGHAALSEHLAAEDAAAERLLRPEPVPA